MTLYIFIFSFVLSYQDWQHQSFPLWLWGLFTLPLLSSHPIHQTTTILLGLALLASLFPLGIGAGDFLYLATLSLVLEWQSILWIIQIASLTGIAYFYLTQRQEQSIPLIPFLTIGYLINLISAQLHISGFFTG